jgi:hypothetical protein
VDCGRESDNDGIRKYDGLTVEILDDLIHVVAHFWPLISNKVTALIPADAGNIGDLTDIPGREAEKVKGRTGRLDEPEGPPSQDRPRSDRHYVSPRTC